MWSWGQVADDRTRKGKVKISAVVDSGAAANALPENMMQWLPLKLSSASKSGKIFRGAGRDPIPARGERSVTGRTDEGQSRRIVWEVCPVKRPLLSVAKITKAGNQVYLGEDKAFVKNNKTRRITNLRRERNVWMLDLWVKTQWMCRVFRGWAAEDLRRHDCDDDRTGSCKTTVGTN